MEKYYLNWEDCDFLWNVNDYLWEDVAIVTEALGGGGSTAITQQRFNDWTKQYPDKKKRIIKLLCTIPELQYKYEKTKNKIDAKISIKDVKLLAEKMNISLNLEKENVI